MQRDNIWPFNYITDYSYQRCYKAALIVLIGASVAENFNDDTQARIETEMDDYLKTSPEGPVAMKKWGTWYQLGAFRASAMLRLGIQPPVAGLTWSYLFKPWISKAKFIPKLWS